VYTLRELSFFSGSFVFLAEMLFFFSPPVGLVDVTWALFPRVSLTYTPTVILDVSAGFLSTYGLEELILFSPEFFPRALTNDSPSGCLDCFVRLSHYVLPSQSGSSLPFPQKLLCTEPFASGGAPRGVTFPRMMNNSLRASTTRP